MHFLTFISKVSPHLSSSFDNSFSCPDLKYCQFLHSSQIPVHTCDLSCPATMSETYTPCLLSPALLNTLKQEHPPPLGQSYIYGSSFAEMRLRALMALRRDQDPWANNYFIPPTRITLDMGAGTPISIPTGDRGGSMLSFCMKLLDIACIYELIRLNHPINAKDWKGETPLLEACIALEFTTRSRHPTAKTAALMAKTLVLHHADVNVMVNGMTPLAFAASAGEWDLCKLLLEHGAKPCPPSANSNLTSEGRLRLNLMVKLHSNSKTRSPRLCPCHSGLTLDNCHNTPDARRGNVLWPSYAVCPCCAGSKPYSKCCLKRGIKYAMYWMNDRLVQDKHFSNVLNEAFLTPEVIERLKQTQAPLNGMNKLESMKPSREQLAKVVNAAVDDLCQEGRLDPAFVYVVRKFGSNNFPVRYDIAKVERELSYREWNRYAEEYIQSGTDLRSQRDTEIVSKCGIDGGPMYRLCESDACAKREEWENEYKRCSKCKMTVYCSKECQKSGWKLHKGVCCSSTQMQQWLPDSGLLAKKISELLTPAVLASRQLIDPAYLERIMTVIPRSGMAG